MSNVSPIRQKADLRDFVQAYRENEGKTCEVHGSPNCKACGFAPHVNLLLCLSVIAFVLGIVTIVSNTIAA